MNELFGVNAKGGTPFDLGKFVLDSLARVGKMTVEEDLI